MTAEPLPVPLWQRLHATALIPLVLFAVALLQVVPVVPRRWRR